MALTTRGLLRLVLFLGGYVIFLVLGATIFSSIESPEELEKVQHLRKLRADFLKNNPTVTGKLLIRETRFVSSR
ncbi:hypothetical protein TcasGA2_TC032217 [Tribolium castaneum]|uniref:Uncharacterized protein n=1 Tax=Tribolium castaneum TaxID=7070 RepID=A0A139WN53_TRICA|nr:hypothetical protein TcasGA2_TC032217 [Tribolium castaneum]